MPNISQQLGEHVRTNRDAIVSILAEDVYVDVTHGTTILSHFHAYSRTHMTQSRFSASYDMKFYMGSLVDGEHPLLLKIAQTTTSREISKWLFWRA